MKLLNFLCFKLIGWFRFWAKLRPSAFFPFAVPKALNSISTAISRTIETRPAITSITEIPTLTLLQKCAPKAKLRGNEIGSPQQSIGMYGHRLAHPTCLPSTRTRDEENLTSQLERGIILKYQGLLGRVIVKCGIIYPILCFSWTICLPRCLTVVVSLFWPRRKPTHFWVAPSILGCGPPYLIGP